MQLYCLDNSDAACRSEDYPSGNRLAWQLSVIRTVSRSLLAPKQTQERAASSTGTDNPALAVITSAGRPALAVAPTADASALLGLDVVRHDGERCQLLGGLRLALLASKRLPTARVLAFLASRADLPADQCRQLSRSFAEAGVSLDLVVLCPDGELSPDQSASLEFLTSVPSYADYDETPPTLSNQVQQPRPLGGSSGGGDAPATATPSAATTAIAASVGRASRPADRLPAKPDLHGSSSAAATDPAATTADRRAGGQRLLYCPPPDPSLALWQQLEPLLEQLQLEGTAVQEPEVTGPESDAGSEDDRAGTSQRRSAGSGPHGPSTSGRPPLPRPPRPRVASASAAESATGIPAPALRTGFAAARSVASRNGGTRGGISSGTCRYESLDSLQHLSLDGFLRSWLPSYANFSRIMPVPPPGSSQPPGAALGGPVGSAPSGSSAAGAGSAGGRSSEGASGAVPGSALGPGRICYINVYRLQLPRWHKLLEVNAGCMYELVQLREGAAPLPSSPGPDSAGMEAEAVAGGGHAGTRPATVVGRGSGPVSEEQQQQRQQQQGGPAAQQGSATAAEPPAVPPRPTVVVPRAPCPVQVHFSTRCSSAAATASTSAAPASGRCHWVCPDLRRGSLSLVASVEDPGLVKLLWNERPSGVAGTGAEREYGNIFMSPAEESGDGGLDPANAELELTLSPTRSQFRIVPHVRGGAVLEVLFPRCAVHRPREPSAALGGPGASCSPAAASTSSTTPSPINATTSAAAGTSTPPRTGDVGSGGLTRDGLSSPHVSYLPQPTQQRYFFWLQQDWCPPRPVDTTDSEDGREATGASAGAEPLQAEPSSLEVRGTRARGHSAGDDVSDEPGRMPPGFRDQNPFEAMTMSRRAEGPGEEGAPAVSRRERVAHGTTDRGSASVLPDRGCGALAEHLQALLECPPEFDPHKHGTRVRCNSTPLKLGPLPFALVEEIMRASGRELNPDGSVTTAAHHNHHSLSAGAVASAPGGPDSIGDTPHYMPRHGSHHQHHYHDHHRTARGIRSEQPAPVPTIDRADSLGLPGISSASASSTARAVTPSAATAVSRAVGAPPPAGAPPVPTTAVLSALTPDQQDVLRGFVRTTYSRGAAPPALQLSRAPGGVLRATGTGPLGREAASASKGVSSVAAAGLVATAAAMLASHPLDEMDWGSDCDSQGEGEDATPDNSKAGAPDCIDDLAQPSCATLQHSGATTEPRIPPCPTRASLAAATAAAAAAAAASVSGGPLVGVDPEAAGSCQKEDSSLLFDLD